MLDFDSLQAHLPPGTIEFVGNQTKLNLSVLSDNNDLVPSSEATEIIALLLQGLVDLTDAVNAERAALNPPLAPVTFAKKELQGTIAAPIIRFTADFKVDAGAFMSNLVDPLPDA